MRRKTLGQRFARAGAWESGMGRKKIILSRDWNKHKEGSTVTVDDLRAAWLKKAGFEAKKGKKSK